MIYTITLNPAIDYYMDYSKEGTIKKWARTENAQLQYGGKGINASVLLTNIEVDNIALVLSGGYTGKILLEALEAEGVKYKNFDTDNNIRINVKAQFDDTYELLTSSLNKNEKLVEELLTYLKEGLKPKDTVMIMGSVMQGLPYDIIEQISQLVQDKGGELIYDISGPHLLKYVKFKPLVIKPNVAELSDIFNVDIKTFDDIQKYAKELIDGGIQNVIVSQDSKGAYVFNKESYYHAKPLKIDLVNGAGAGDSMISGFTAKILQGQDIDEALDYANACGAGTASVIKIASKATINNLFNKVEKNKKENYA